MKIGNIEVYGIIYKITNKINGKCYIGQTIKGFDRRYGKDLEKATHNGYLRREINKYGIENFEIIKVYDIAFSREELDLKEITWIKIHDSYNNGYNLDIGGSGRKIIPDEERKEISKRMSGENNPNYGGIGWRYNKIICLTTGEVFETAKEANEKYKECKCGSNSKIIACCRKRRKSAGKLNGEPLLWMYYEEYLKLNSEELETYKNNCLTVNRENVHMPTGKENKKSKPIICLTTNRVFYLVKEAESFYNCSNISYACKGKRNYAGKLEDGTPLVWRYLTIIPL